MKEQINELRKIAEEPNGHTQKYLLRQVIAGIADLMELSTDIVDRQNEADDERTELRHGQKKNADTLKNYNRGVWTVLGAWLLWVVGNVLDLL